MTSFWWNSKEGDMKICWTSWDKMTLPKQLGGLGFRDVQLFNLALLAKIGWRIITKPDSLLARTLLGKYCHKTSFLKATKPSNSSHGWNGILHGRDLLLGHLGKVIGDGESTRVWTDSWIDTTNDFLPTGPALLQDQDLMVADLLSRETKEWNKALVERLFPTLTEHILSLRPSTTGTSDTFIWTQQKSGIYSAKSGYFVAKIEKTQSTSSLLEQQQWNWQKFIWTPKLLPKIKIFMWRCALNNLPTGDNLRKKGLLGHTSCAKCGEEETIEHILFLCEPAKEAWNLCPWTTPIDPLGCSSFRTSLELATAKVNLPPIGTSSNLFAWICWSLWLSRNQFTFEGKTTPPREIISRAITLLKEWEQAQPPPSPPMGNPPQQIPIQIASQDSIILYTDAAWNKETREAGLAWIFTNRSGDEINRGYQHQKHVSSAFMAESLAVRAALLHAVSLNYTIIWLRSDCKGLIQAITTNQWSAELFGVLSDIESTIVPSFIAFYSSFIPRALNGSVDLLAKTYLCNRISVLGSSPH